MKKLTYTLEIQSPVVISDTTGGQNHIKSMNYIPGSTILGVFAGKFIAKNHIRDVHKDSDFNRLFLSNSVRFLNANIENNDKRAITIPSYFEQLKQEFGEVFDNFEKPQPEGIERQSAKAVSGFSDGKQKLSVKKEVAFHTVRNTEKHPNRITGKSEDGGIFTYEGIATGQVMKGEIIGNESDLNSLKSLFSDCEIVHLGRSKTAQYGEAELSFGNIETVGEKSEGNTITLQFRSLVLITNEFGFPSTKWDDLKLELEKNGLSDIELKENANGWKSASAKSISVENYNRKWGAKKPSHHAFTAGSAFKISAKGIDEFVKNVSENGIGLRTNEGFGEVSIETLSTNSFKQQKSQSYKKPNSDTPVGLFTQIIKNEVLKLAEMEGAKVSFNKKLLNSVNGQLIDVLRSADNDEQIKSEMNKRVTIRITWDKPEVGDKRTEYDQDVLKKFALNLKECKLMGSGDNLWEIFSNADSKEYCKKNIKQSDFIKIFPKEVGINIDQFDFEFYKKYWITALTKMMKKKETK
ncbi:MAG: hypothetical protein H8E71_04055 [Candidatus Marinimicrobia bacterium]|nr:hypothetical protein [Candidatus Neomarinimicrobiota bacterium]